jgi:hypothetical protein
MNSIRRIIPVAAAMAVVALLAAGCGSVSPTTTTTGAAAGSGPPTDGAASAYRYSACMRDHGVSNFPDPKVHMSSNGGSTQVSVMIPAGVGDSPQLSAARTACQGILPAPSNSDLAAQAKQREVHKQDLLAFAHCLRSHGISGFPDPNAEGQLTLPMVQAAGIDLTAPRVRTAALACVPASNGAITRAAVIEATSGNVTQSGGQASQSSGASSNP